MNKKLEEIRKALADYMQSEGCDCCRNAGKHENYWNYFGMATEEDS